MKKASEIISIISKIMNEEAENKCKIEVIYDDIYNLLFRELCEKLDEVKYPFVSDITQKLREVMQNFDMYNKLPYLLEKNIIKISDENKQIAQAIFSSEKELNTLKKNKNLPFFIFKGKERKFYIINYVNRIIEITESEYQKIQLLYQNNLEIRKLIKSYIFITPNYKYKNLVSIIIPKYFQIESKKYINNLKTYIINENEIIKYVKQDNKLEDVLESLNKTSINFDLSIKLENILLDIENYYLILSSDKKKQVELLTKNLIEINEKSELKKEIKKYKEEALYEMESVEQFYAELQKLKYQIIDNSKKYENEVSDILSYQLKGNVESSLYIKDILDKFFKLLKVSDFLQIKDCILKLKMANYKYFSELEIIYKILQKKEISQYEILSIKKISEKNSEFSKLKIILSKELKYSEKELLEIVSNIPLKWQEGKENFYLAKKAYVDGKHEEAEKKYKKSLEFGYLEAGKELINNLRKDKNYDYNMEKLADNLIMEANYIIGKKSLAENKFKKGMVYLKMAASKNHLEAIEYIADVLFEKYKKMPWKEVVFADDEDIERKKQDDVKVRENQKNINNIINLYRYLFKYKNNVKYSERIGLLLCKIGYFREGLEKLRNVDSYEAIYQCARIYLHGEGVAQDLEQAKFYFEKIINKNLYTSDIHLKRIEKKVHEDYKKTCDWIKNKEKRKKSYVKRTSYRSTGSSSCCYIITATCMALGIKRNKDFFNMLIKFRDNYIKYKNGRKHILEYYRVSPKIAEIIDREWNPFITYKELWEDYINPSIKEMEKDNWDKAKKIYNSMLKNLCEYYSIKVRKSVAQEYSIKIF